MPPNPLGKQVNPATAEPELVQDVQLGEYGSTFSTIILRGNRPKLTSMTSRERRIKCDERKPQCVKCISSRRTCGGYTTAIVRFVDNRGAHRRWGTTRVIPSLSSTAMRSVLLGINGNHMQKQFFSSYRRATEAGVAMHSCDISSFWTTLAPQLGHHDEAVKHALVALGAAYHLYKVSKGKSSHLHSSSPAIEQLERFTWREYNLAIKHLHRHLHQPDPQSIALVLVSCLAFVSLELLRGDHSTAITHMRNGIRIATSALDVQRLKNASPKPWAAGSLLSESDVWEIIIQLRNVEFALGGFSSDIPLTLGRQLRNNSSHWEAGSISNVTEGYEARTEYVNDVMVRCWELREHRGDKPFWAQPHMQQEIRMMRQLGATIMSGLESLWAGPQAPQPGTWLSYSSQMDWLLANSARTLIELVPFGLDSHLEMAHQPQFQDELSRGVFFAAKMQLTHDSAGKPPSDYTLEIGVVGLMYWSYVYSNRPETKAAALKILQESEQRQGPWDAERSLKFISGEAEPNLLISFWRNPHTISHPGIPWQTCEGQ